MNARCRGNVMDRRGSSTLYGSRRVLPLMSYAMHESAIYETRMNIKNYHVSDSPTALDRSDASPGRSRRDSREEWEEVDSLAISFDSRR